LIDPCCALLVVETIGSWAEVVTLGPTFSNHVWSTVWEARDWPRTRPSLGVIWWTRAGKYPSMLEKWWEVGMGVVLTCLLVIDASSRAVANPKMVTISALNFRAGCIVITGVLRGTRLEVIRRPAIMLPQASRLMGLRTVGLFSLIGESAAKRGCPAETKKITRRL